MEEKFEDRIRISTGVRADAYIVIHSAQDGHEEEVDVDDFAGVADTKSGTKLCYKTGNPDCEIEAFYVKENASEVMELYREAVKRKIEAAKKSTVVDRLPDGEKYQTVRLEVLDELYRKAGRRDDFIGTASEFLRSRSFFSFLSREKFISDFRKFMEEVDLGKELNKLDSTLYDIDDVASAIRLSMAISTGSNDITSKNTHPKQAIDDKTVDANR